MASRNRRTAPGVGNRQPQPRDRALYEMTKQHLESLRASVDASMAKTGEAVEILGDIATTLGEINQTGGGGGGVSVFGGGVGGVFSIGPNGRPIMPPNQSQRPVLGPMGYPGGTGYGMQGNHGLGGGGGGMGGIFGVAQNAVAQMIHRSKGLGQGGAVRYERNSDGTYTSFDAKDKVVENDIPQQVFAQRTGVSQRAAAVGSSRSIFGAIKGAVGELPTGVKVAGGVATGLLAAAETAHKYGQFIGNQRAANAQYQAIFGGPNGGAGPFGMINEQRMHNFGYRFGNFMNNLGAGFGIGDGGLSDADADKAFKGVSAMGFQGGTRNDMLAWTRGNFNQLGMSVDQTLQLIGVNAKEASTNLSELRIQLKGVSEMAQQTGQSAEVFRQAFIQSYSHAVSAGFGPSSGAVASAQVASTVGQGRLFAGLDTSAMYSTLGGQQVLANREGYGSVLDFALAGQANPMVIANAQQRQLNQVFMSVVSPDVRALIEEAIRRRGGAQNVATNQNAALSVVNDVEHRRPGALNAIAIIQAMRAAGIAGAENLDATAAAIYYVQWVAKQGRNFTNPTAKAVAANQQRTGAAAGDFWTHIHNNNQLGFGVNAKGQNTYDPVIGHMQSDDVKTVKVDTRQGPQVVSLETASHLYRDQLTRGTAVIMSGQNTGQTVGAVYGKETNARFGDSTRSKAQGSTFDPKTWKMIKSLNLTDAQIGQLATGIWGSIGGDKFKQQVVRNAAIGMAKENQGGALSGTITVGLKPDVARYLEISTTGDSLVNRAAAAGAPPALNANGSSTGR